MYATCHHMPLVKTMFNCMLLLLFVHSVLKCVQVAIQNATSHHRVLVQSLHHISDPSTTCMVLYLCTSLRVVWNDFLRLLCLIYAHDKTRI